MAIEMMELLAMLAAGRDQEIIDNMAQKAEAPEFNPAGGVLPPSPVVGATPGINPTAPPLQAPTGGLTGPGLAGLPGAIGTQSGPAVQTPIGEKNSLEKGLAAVLGGGIVPEAGFAEQPAPGQAPGGGPSLGNSVSVTPFNLGQQDPAQQAQISLARLLNGGG